MYFSLVLALSCYVSVVLSGYLGPCKKEDIPCVHKTFSNVFPLVIGGIPSLKMESADPMFVKVIEGNFSALKYKLTNITITGYKHCVVTRIKLDLVALNAFFELDCSNITLVGDYEIHGKLISTPVEGTGTFTITASRYLIPVTEYLKLSKGQDGKTYITVINYEIKPRPIGPMSFEFDNLFNGQKDLSDAVHKFAHENYKQVAELLQDPILNAGLESIMRNINVFLTKEPLEEIFLD